MNHKERFIHALQCKQVTGRVPHFELDFFLTMEAFGKLNSLHRAYFQWNQMSEHERQLHRNDIADLHIAVAHKFEHDAIFLHPNPVTMEETIRLADIVRDKIGDEYFLMIHGDATHGIPNGDNMLKFTYRMTDDADGMKAESSRLIDENIERAAMLREKTDIDGFALCSDYCMNNGPFMSPTQFGEFVTPYLKKLIAGYRELGFYSIKHTDGNIMPIIDQLMECAPDALHSLDPQGGVDIAEIKRDYGDKVCLIGNVHCGLMETGTDEEVIESARYCLKHGMPGGGYIFSTSNCIYTGMSLSRYELILDVWRKEGCYM